MNPLINQAYDASSFREQGHNLIDMLADYLESIRNDSEAKVFKPFDPDKLFNHWHKKINSPADNNFGALAKEIIEDSIHLHHPGYMGHQVSPVLPEAALADLLSAFLNNGVGVYEMGSPTVAIERAVIKQLAGQLGFDENADGILTSGGTLGNLTALLAARQIMSGQDAWKNGTGDTQYAFIVSEQAHYCINRAVKIMGWGEEGIITVPVDKQFRMDTSQLERVYKSAKKRGTQVLGVVGSACSTATGSFDPLLEIGDFCQKHNIWFHVDAAHGGAAAYSARYRSLLNGIEKADSVVVDFHKMMLCPALVTGLVFKDSSQSYRTFAQRASYLWNQEGKEWYNLGKRTFECTKDMMALKIYFVLRQYGPELFEEIVDHLFDLGHTFAKLIDGHSDFETLINPSCNIVCFRHLPDGVNDLNQYNRTIRRRLIDRGNKFVVQTEIDGTVYLRTTLMNVFTGSGTLEELLDEIAEIAETMPTK